MSTTATKVRRGPRYTKSTGRPDGPTATLLVPALASSYDAAEKLIQRLEMQVTAFARLAAVHPVLRDRLRKVIASAIDVVRVGQPLPWSSELAVAVAGHDGTEDGPLAKVCATPHDVPVVKQWLRLAEAEQEARAEGIASARSWLQSQVVQ